MVNALPAREPGHEVGLRELRQNASELLRRVESGEEITITVSGRPSARLIAANPRSWRNWSQTAELFNGSTDETWAQDRDALDATPRDPWAAL
ncbi:MAG: type II toxin-antitoxin system Phd/YefM family antitoxin [Actinomycetales bacterium]|nr:type II toxin-antitoxin system Phd/YefM family antitoxin [Actinomycetales bacterium]